MSENLEGERDCIDCHNPFKLTPGEQKFYTERMADDPNFKAPKRCKLCIRKKRQERDERGY